MRLRSDIWVAALLRNVEIAGSFGAVLRRGSPEAGAIFIQLLRRDGKIDLYVPAPQTAYDPESSNWRDNERRFFLSLKGGNDAELRDHYEKEARFDPDFWAIEIEGEVNVALFEVVDLNE